MVDDLGDYRSALADLARRVKRLETTQMLENAAVYNGRLRFIGGELRIDSGGKLVVKGTLEVDGMTTVTGDFTVTGPWTLTGNGTIAGDVSVTGAVEFVGDVAVKGNFSVESGGKITCGNVEIRDGKLFIGGMELDPTSHSGYIKMPNGAEVLGNGSNLELFSAGTVKNVLRIVPGGAAIAFLPTSSSTGSYLPLYWDPITGSLIAQT